MKIYFAGSIRGGRQDAVLYHSIIDLLKHYGQVLTEHVGSMDLTGENLPDDAIYQRDMDWLVEADVLVAEVTRPSHGVGFEVARAETLRKPILCLHRPETGRRLSALIGGNPAVHCERYKHTGELPTILDAFLEGDLGTTSELS